MKNTRLVYNDEKNLKIYQTLSPEDFKEFFMTYLTYKPGTELEITDFSNPLLYALFLSFKDKIDYNEAKWEKQAAAKRENGKKGGRPKKSALQDIVETEFDIPKTEDNIEDEIKAILSPSNIKEVEEPQPIEDNVPESLNTTKNEVKQSIPLRVAASEYFRPTEKLQELINSDDNFCTIYNRCINYIADYKLNPGDFVKSNSKNIAFSRLERLFGESEIAFNDDIKDFINNDVTAKMNSLARQEKID